MQQLGDGSSILLCGPLDTYEKKMMIDALVEIARNSGICTHECSNDYWNTEICIETKTKTIVTSDLLRTEEDIDNVLRKHGGYDCQLLLYTSLPRRDFDHDELSADGINTIYFNPSNKDVMTESRAKKWAETWFECRRIDYSLDRIKKCVSGYDDFYGILSWKNFNDRERIITIYNSGIGLQSTSGIEDDYEIYKYMDKVSRLLVDIFGRNVSHLVIKYL